MGQRTLWGQPQPLAPPPSSFSPPLPPLNGLSGAALRPSASATSSREAHTARRSSSPTWSAGGPPSLVPPSPRALATMPSISSQVPPRPRGHGCDKTRRAGPVATPASSRTSRHPAASAASPCSTNPETHENMPGCGIDLGLTRRAKPPQGDSTSTSATGSVRGYTRAPHAGHTRRPEAPAGAPWRAPQRPQNALARSHAARARAAIPAGRPAPGPGPRPPPS